MLPYILKWRLEEKDAGKTIKQWLNEQSVSRRTLAKIKFDGGSIKVNGTEQNVLYVLEPGDLLEVQFPEEAINENLKKEDIPIDIVYEDKDVLVINKPAGMNTIPSREHPTGSLANALAHYYQEKERAFAIHIVTRLDRNTSGLVLVAKHRHAHHVFGRLQSSKQLGRTYEGFAHGVFRSASATIDAPIGRKPASIIEREVREDGKRAVTTYEVIRQFQTAAHVKIQLETGRTHQIRVHFSHIGHPLLGDDLYGGPDRLIKRQALHCSRLYFFHPFMKKEMDFRAPLPPDLLKLRDSLA
jgi:23S rRNA pseudouridine1911/1915/1917 synthase